MSKKNQVAVPSQMRKQLGIQSGDNLIFDVRDGYAFVVPELIDFSLRLRGLHREVWQDLDPQEHVTQERDAWRT